MFLEMWTCFYKQNWTCLKNIWMWFEQKYVAAWWRYDREADVRL